MFAVARWQKVLSKMKKLRGKDKLMAEIYIKNFTLNMKSLIGCFGISFF